MSKPKANHLLKIVTGENTMIPEWQRTSFFDQKNRTIFIPAIEADIVNAKTFKAQGQIINYQNHQYLSLSIIQRLHPDQDFSDIEQQILALVDKQNK